MRHRVRGSLCVFLLSVMMLFGSRPAASSTQKGAASEFGAAIPIGHEWLATMAANELFTRNWQPGDDDPRKTWTKGRAKNLDMSEAGAQNEITTITTDECDKDPKCQYYMVRYTRIYAAIVGQRWVDAGGFNVLREKTGTINCFDAVSQEAVEVQYDHFMRRWDDPNVKGAIDTAEQSRQRFIKYFEDAAMTYPGMMRVFDGGGKSEITDVQRNYFLLGRAMHLLQDSFSSEHTVRMSDDEYRTVRQIKSYMCAAGSEQHSQGLRKVLDYSSGDVIWLSKTGPFNPNNMKETALAATEATKDLLAAFIRTMGVPRGEQRRQRARAEAATIAKNWMAMDAEVARTWYDDESHRDATYVLGTGQNGKGQTVSACMRSLGEPSGEQETRARQLVANQRKCVYNILPESGYEDLFDPQLHIWYTWRWRNPALLETPPLDYVIKNEPADSGVPVRIQSLEGQRQYMTAPKGVANNEDVACTGKTPLVFVQVPTKLGAVYRLSGAPGLFLSYWLVSGSTKLYSSPQDADFKLTASPEGVGMYNEHTGCFLWLKDWAQPMLTKYGNPQKKQNARWSIERVP